MEVQPRSLEGARYYIANGTPFQTSCLATEMNQAYLSKYIWMKAFPMPYTR